MDITSGMQPIKAPKLGQFYEPNLGLIDKVLDKKQKTYNSRLSMFGKLKGKVDEVPALEGYDLKRYHEKQEEYENRLNEITDLYGGDLTKADAEFDALINKASKDFGIHGEFTALNNRYQSATKNYQELLKRKEADEITDGQFRRWSKELRETAGTGIGTNPKNWNSWDTVAATDAIKPEVFLKDFMSQKVANYNEMYDKPQRIMGKLVWTKEGKEVISYDELLADGKKAFREAASRTGQLEADYEWAVYSGKHAINKDKYINGVKGQYDDVQTELEKLNTLSGEDLQHFINGYFSKPVLAIDGMEGENTDKYKNLIQENLESRANELNTKYSELNKLSDEEFEAYDRNTWFDQTLERIVDPYAGINDMFKRTVDKQMVSDPYTNWQYKQEELRLGAKLELDILRAKYEMENPTTPQVAVTGPQEEVTVPGGENVDENRAYLKGLEKKKQNLVSSFFKGLADDGYFGENDKDTIANLTEMYQSAKEVLGRPPTAEDLANAEVVPYSQGNGASLVFKNQAGETYNLNLEGIDSSVLIEAQEGILSLNNKQKLAEQRMEEAREASLNDLSREDRYILENFENKDFDELEDLYKELKSKSWEFQGSTFEDFKENLQKGNTETLELLKSALESTEGIFGNLFSKIDNYSILREYATLSSEYLEAQNKVVEKSNNYLKESQTRPVTRTMTNYFYTTDPKTNNIRRKALQDAIIQNADDIVATNLDGKSLSQIIEENAGKDFVFDADESSAWNVTGSKDWGYNAVFINSDTGERKVRKMYIPFKQVSTNFADARMFEATSEVEGAYLDGFKNGLKDYTVQYKNLKTNSNVDVTFHYPKRIESPGGQELQSPYKFDPQKDLHITIDGKRYEGKKAFDMLTEFRFDNSIVKDMNTQGNAASIPYYVKQEKDIPLVPKRNNQGEIVTNSEGEPLYRHLTDLDIRNKVIATAKQYMNKDYEFSHTSGGTDFILDQIVNAGTIVTPSGNTINTITKRQAAAIFKAEVVGYEKRKNSFLDVNDPSDEYRLRLK